MEIEAIHETQMEVILEVENLGKRTGNKDTSITNRIQEIADKISGIEDTIEEIDASVKENAKSKKFLTQNTQEIWGTMGKKQT
jgi:methyl-accepting chemotaxis protein